MDFNDAATAAIESWCETERPESADFVWAGKKPAADWQYDATSWTGEMSRIQREFETRINFPISFSRSEKRKTVDLSMLTICFILVRKAEAKSGRTLLKALLS